MVYSARANAIIDEPMGDLNTEVQARLGLGHASRFGRTKNFDQTIRATYRVPLDKIPLLDWMAADVTYAVGYQFQANSYGLTDSTGRAFGNTITQQPGAGHNGRVDLIRLYNKIKSLRFANNPSRPGRILPGIRATSKRSSGRTTGC